jgi:hypothetical protein
MSTQPTANNKVEIDGCKERVAFDLMKFISSNVKDAMKEDKNQETRKRYYFDLFKECLELVSNKAEVKK